MLDILTLLANPISEKVSRDFANILSHMKRSIDLQSVEFGHSLNFNTDMRSCSRDCIRYSRN
jgi:hypothetical protein